MPKKKPPKKNETPQRDRFVIAARNAGASESASAFDRAFAKVTAPAKPKREEKR